MCRSMWWEDKLGGKRNKRKIKVEISVNEQIL